MISGLNGAVALSQGARRLDLGGVIEFTANGGLNCTMFAEMAAFEFRIKARAVGVAIGSDGQPIPTIPQPSEVQTWTEIATNVPLLEDALIHFGRADDWFDIYKCLECLFTLYGGEAEFYKLKWAPRSRINLMKQSADLLRHAIRARPTQVRPPHPMKIKEAQDLLKSLLRRALEDKRARP